MKHLSLALKGIMVGVSIAVMLLAGLLVFLFFKPMGLPISVFATLSYFLSITYLFTHLTNTQK